MPAVSADRFLDALRQSGLLAADRLDAQLRRSAAEGPPEDARELAVRFVRDGLLTPFQAERLLQGRWQELIIAGKYAVLALIGAGGMGQVYLCEHLVLRRRAAVKLLPARLVADPVAVERFHREARAVAALDHPNIVRAYDVDAADDLNYLVMEYVEGVSLHELVSRGGPLAADAAADYIAQAARGLQHAHEAGWVHRDVKPANLLLDRTGTVKLLDLGLARLLDENVEPITAATDALGTADFLAPEQGADSHAADIRADIYSLGATFYFLLTGRPPFPEGTASQKVLWHQTRLPRPVQELRPDTPSGLASVLNRMLAKDPAGRYQTPAAVADALKSWAGNGPYPPPADLAGAGGPRSGVRSSWARHAGLSGTKITPVPGPRGVADTAVPADPTVRVAARSPTGDRFAGSPPQSRSPIRRWPILGIAVVAVGITIGGVAAFRPKTPPPEPPMVVQYEPPPKLSEQPAGQIQQFIGHTEAIEKVAFTPDGKRLVTASKDKTVRVWDIATGRELRTLIGHTGIVRGLTVLPDNRRAATAGWDGTVRLWDLDTGEELRQYPGHKGQVWWVECDAAGRRLLTAGQDGTIRLWDVNAGTAIKVMGKHFGTATAAVFLADGKRAVSAGEDGNVFLWDLTTGDRIGRTRAPKMVYRLSLCPEGRWVLFGSDHWFLRWDPDGKLHPTRVPDVTDSIETVVGLPDGRLILAVVDGTIRLWQTKPERELHQFSANGQAVLSLAVAPDGKHFASAGRDKVARLWAIPTLSR